MIGNKLKTARNAKGYSQEYMAIMLNITQASYSRIEANIINPDLAKLKIIVNLLDLDLNSLLEVAPHAFKSR